MDVDRWLQILRRARWRELVGGLVVGAFLLSALVPTGYMPSFDGPGLLKLCSGKVLQVDDPVAPGDEPHADPPCPFATLSWVIAPATTAVFTTPSRLAMHVPAPRATAARSRDGPPRIHAPRGPPVFS